MSNQMISSADFESGMVAKASYQDDDQGPLTEAEPAHQHGAFAVAGPNAPQYENTDLDVFTTTSTENAQTDQNAAVSAEIVDTEAENRKVQARIDKELAEREKNTPIAEVVSDRRFSPRVQRLGIAGILLVIAAIVLAIVLSRLDPEPTPTLTPPPPTLTPPPPGLIELLSSVSPDGGAALNTISSPQSNALNWLAGNINLDSYSNETKIQRYALATLHYSTGGDDWRQNTDWLGDNDECGWYTNDEIQFCSPTGEIALALISNNLNGRIPEEIGLLTNLGRLFCFLPLSFSNHVCSCLFAI